MSEKQRIDAAVDEISVSIDPRSPEASFIEEASRALASLSDVNPWNVISSIAESIDATSGISYKIGERMVPVALINDERPISASLVFNGARSNGIRASEFMNLLNKVDNQTDEEVASSRFSMVFVVLEGRCRFTKYTLSEELPGERIGGDARERYRAVRCGDYEASPGEIIVRDRLRNIISFDQRLPSVLLAAVSYHSESKYQFVFDRHHGGVRSIVDFDVKASRRIKAMHILSKYGDQSSVAALSELLDDDHHMLRWMAIKRLARLDPENIRSYLLKGAQDMNTEISIACSSILAKLGAQQEGRA
ncbi:HEAT repeat domain-containing protein [Stenotrophomonas geniculata]|uniref:HEAT repeat domain-containing protein n=1 Tax=Stenotrophomonas geniculata TaxID=86188 RepID=UPI00287FCBC9|nr:HEAT repeat domain-containing protein [Stenotrophomonas geniculata]WNF10519.1 HEAT repeat domain-containing protein [Stenotrophomonas geniculata]